MLSILEKVDDRLASLERHMAPIRRVCACVVIDGGMMTGGWFEEGAASILSVGLSD